MAASSSAASEQVESPQPQASTSRARIPCRAAHAAYGAQPQNPDADVWCTNTATVGPRPRIAAASWESLSGPGIAKTLPGQVHAAPLRDRLAQRRKGFGLLGRRRGGGRRRAASVVADVCCGGSAVDEVVPEQAVSAQDGEARGHHHLHMSRLTYEDERRPRSGTPSSGCWPAGRRPATSWPAGWTDPVGLVLDGPAQPDLPRAGPADGGRTGAVRRVGRPRAPAQQALPDQRRRHPRAPRLGSGAARAAAGARPRDAAAVVALDRRPGGGDDRGRARAGRRTREVLAAYRVGAGRARRRPEAQDPGDPPSRAG